MMTESQRLLLLLIRSALHKGCVDLSRFRPNWSEIYSLAQMQGVEGIVFDALCDLPAESRPPRTLLLSWIGKVASMERRYDQYVQAIKSLSAQLEGINLCMMLMKGYGCSLNYPNPKHRPCGDIDIFVMNPYGEHTQAIVKLVDDWAIKQQSCHIIHDNEHHSVFQYGKFVVENHETILDINTHKSSIALNRLLESLATGSLLQRGKNEIIIPSARFNSIHLLRHMANDFATVKTSLRHVLDWSTFVYAHNDEVDWPFIYDIAHQANMHRFLDAINSICVDYFCYSSEDFPIEQRDCKLRDRVLNDILSLRALDKMPPMGKRIRYGWAKSKRLWQNRWKYKIVYDESLWNSFCSLALNRINKM